MSNWGLEIRNGQGFTSLDPDTFTVKLIESVWVGWTTIDQSTVIDIPIETTSVGGVFAVITIYKMMTAVLNPDMQIYFQSNAQHPQCLPVVEVYPGMVRVRGQPVPGSRATGMIVINLMKYL